MGGSSNKGETCKQFLDLMSDERKSMVRGKEALGASEERKLELRLGLPGDWVPQENGNSRDKEESLLSLGCIPNLLKATTSAGAKRGFTDTESDSNGKQSQKLSATVMFPSPWSSSSTSSLPHHTPHQQNQAFLQFQTVSKFPTLRQDPSEINAAKLDLKNQEQKACSPASPANPSNPAQNRNTSGPVVGWPPIRSFRKNIASSSSKPAAESQNGDPKIVEKVLERPAKKGLFVKINMDGVAIGRKVDLLAYDSYEKLSCAVDELFRDLLAAQNYMSGTQSGKKERVAIEGLLDGSGEYTLVYEDNEGDRMLVGDVPWKLFVSTVKRLRVLKSSELSALRLGSNKQEKLSPACGAK